MFNVKELEVPIFYSNKKLRQCANEMAAIIDKSLTKLKQISPTLREQYDSTLNWIELANQNYASNDRYFSETKAALQLCFHWIKIAINKLVPEDPNLKEVIEHFLALAQQFDVVQMKAWRFQIQNQLIQRQQKLSTMAKLTESVASFAIDPAPTYIPAQQALTASSSSTPSSSTPSSSKSMDKIERPEDQVTEEEEKMLDRFCSKRSQKKLTTSVSSSAIGAIPRYTPMQDALTVTSSSTPSPDPVILGLDDEIMPDADTNPTQDDDGGGVRRFCFQKFYGI